MFAYLDGGSVTQYAALVAAGAAGIGVAMKSKFGMLRYGRNKGDGGEASESEDTTVDTETPAAQTLDADT